MKSILKFTTLFLILVLLTLIPVNRSKAAKKVTVKKVAVTSSVTKDSKILVVAKGKKVKLDTEIEVTPNKTSNKKVSYSSKNKKIATVSSKGVVKGVKAGKTKVTVTSKKNKKKKATIAVKVYKGVVTKVAFEKATGTINVGEKTTLKAIISAKKDACETLIWTSSNDKVATVSANGEITAITEGNAVITAKAIDGSGEKATYTVKVEDPIDIKDITVLNSQTITFSLNKAYALKGDEVSLMNKNFEKGTYQNQLIANIFLKGEKTWQVLK